MNPLIIKSLHVMAAMGVFSALAATFLASNPEQQKAAAKWHGISLLALLLVGFALLKKPPMELHYWKVKLVLWLFLGVAPVLSRKKIMPAPVLMSLCFVVAGLAAYLGMTRNW
jgi:hypothetical protein